MQVALGPQANLHALAAGIFAKLFQVLDIAVQGAGLSVAGTVAVVGQKPSQREVVVEIAVYGGTCAELVVVLFAVQAFADATVVLLAFVIALAVLVGHETFFRFCPVVAVVGIEVSLVESELGQQHGLAGDLVIVVEQCLCPLVHHQEVVGIVGLVVHDGLVRFAAPEIIFARGEGVPHQAVSARAPIEWVGAGHATVGPVVVVDNLDDLLLVAEPPVLAPAAVEIVGGRLAEGHRYPFLPEIGTAQLLHYGLAVLLDGEGAGAGVHLHLDGVGGEHVAFHLERAHCFAWVVGQDACFGSCLRVTDDASLWVLEDTDDAGAIEVEIHSLAFW